MTDQGEIARDAHGNPILDRFGRPVRRRPAARGAATPAPAADHSPGARPAPEPTHIAPAHPQPTAQGQNLRPGAGATATSGYPPRQIPGAAPQPARPQPRLSTPVRVPGVGAANSVTGEATTGDAPTRRRRRRIRPWLVLKLAVLALVLLVAGSLALVETSLHRVAYQPAQAIGNTSGSNWLIVGSDSRQGLTEKDVQRLGTGGDIGAGRTDTIMVLHQPLFGRPTLLSIPRDSYVEVPGEGMEKINAAFAQGGPTLLTQTVENATGLHIDHYAEIGFAGFAGLVDAVGGVELCPKEAINDPLAHINIQPGCQKFTGPTALGYVRTRATALGDLDRVQRQREFFTALVDKASSPATLANPLRSVPMMRAVAKLFTVGEGDHVWNLARLALGVAGGVDTTTVPVGGFEDTNVGNVVLWDEPRARELFTQLGARSPS